MRIDLLFPELPPAFDGIGDYTARMAAALARQGHAVRVLTARADATPIPGVEIEHAFSLNSMGGVQRVVSVVEHDPPDWVVLQYNPFSWGRWGFAPMLPFAVRALKRAHPHTRIAVMVHEPFVRVESVRFAVMTLWQRWQLWSLGHLADALFFSIEAWTTEFQRWYPSKPVHHLPVGSNIRNVEAPREAARAELGIEPDRFVMGVFGCTGHVRLLPFIAQAARAIQKEKPKAMMLYVGGHGADVQAAAQGVPVMDAGRLPDEEVSRCFSAMDLYLTPFIDGVSTRRGSFLVALQHGLPTIGTDGYLTDTMLREADGTAFLLSKADDPDGFTRHALNLARDPAQRTRLGDEAHTYFEAHFAWDHLAETMLGHMAHVTPSRSNVEAAP